MNTSVCRLALVGLVGAMSISLPGPSFGADAAGACKSLDPMKASVIAKAEQGPDALRRYVYITQGIHQLNTMQVADSIDAWRAEAGCTRRVAGDAALPPVALLSRR